MKILALLSVLTFLLSSTAQSQNQPFYFGNDLSYVNMMEDCGAIYREGGVPKDPFAIFADQETNLIRVRLWVDPSWWQIPLNQPAGVKPYYSDLEDVKLTIQRAKSYDMEVMLDLHISDFWADPGRQLIPRQWVSSANNNQALADSVYNYVKGVLLELDSEGLMPNIVKFGNENNPGILRHIPEENGFGTAGSVSSNNNWQRHGLIFNAGISAIREVGETASINPKIALHWSNLAGVNNWYSNMINNGGVTDFDIIGFSYYYAWHGGSIAQLESTVRTLKNNFPGYEVMAVETGYLWTQNFGGIINVPDPEYLPVTPEKQLEYMVDYTRAVMRAGGNGVIFWEPAWVHTPCVTPWVTGSSHRHVVFFAPVTNNFMENGGGKWTNSEFYFDAEEPKVTFFVDMSEQSVSVDGVFIEVTLRDQNEPELHKMLHLGNQLYSFYTYLPLGATGDYFFINGIDENGREIVPEACSNPDTQNRSYTVSNSAGTSFSIGYQFGTCESLFDDGPVEVTFLVDMSDSGVDYSNGVYITGAFSNETNWLILPMTEIVDNIYSYTTELMPGESGAYYYLTTDTWDNYQNYRETVPAACAVWYNSDRGYLVPNNDVYFGHKWGSCEEIQNPTSIDDIIDSPTDILLSQNYPNPFNPTTQINYTISESARVRLTVYNQLGQHIATLVDSYQSGGNHQVMFDGSRLASGLYIYQLQVTHSNNSTANRLLTRKMLLVK